MYYVYYACEKLGLSFTEEISVTPAQLSYSLNGWKRTINLDLPKIIQENRSPKK